MMRVVIGAAAVAAMAIGGGFWIGAPAPLPELIRVEGGSYSFGNFTVPFRHPNGDVTEALVRTPAESANEPTPVTVASFAMMKTEPTNALFDRYLSDNGLPPRWKSGLAKASAPDRPAQMSLDEARGFCAWVGEEYGVPMRLPYGSEWEWAARSRGQIVPWATDNGEWEPGRNINNLSSLDPEFPPPVGSFPGNPLGLQGMADGLYEWIEAMNPLYLGESIAFFKGGSDSSSTQFETIPTRGVARPIGMDLLETLPHLSRYGTAVMPLMLANATARCVTPVHPDDGIGTLPGPIRSLPTIFRAPQVGVPSQ